MEKTVTPIHTAAPGIHLSSCTQDALAHIRYLSQVIGGRGSCTENEKQAADYVTAQLNGLGMLAVERQPFKAIPSTYWGYGLSFAVALTGSALVVVLGGRDVLILAAILNLLGIWGMLAETDFAPTWTHWVLPKAGSQNVIASIPPGWKVPAGKPAKTAVDGVGNAFAQNSEPVNHVLLCAHIDTHRTPVIYSSETWYRWFKVLVSISFLSMVLGALLFGLAALFYTSTDPILALISNPRFMFIAALIFLIVQAAALALCIQADFTGYSPGANDNASGVGALLALASRIRAEHLQHTHVHLLFTGCEEVGDRGIGAFIDAHAKDLGRKAIFIVLDEIALGHTKFLSRDGLLLRRKTHPYVLDLARQAQQQHPNLHVIEGPGLAYTDALEATRRGFPALTICAVPQDDSDMGSHWHRMTDTVDNLSPQDLQDAIEFTWQVLQVIDQEHIQK